MQVLCSSVRQPAQFRTNTRGIKLTTRTFPSGSGRSPSIPDLPTPAFNTALGPAGMRPFARKDIYPFAQQLRKFLSESRGLNLGRAGELSGIQPLTQPIIPSNRQNDYHSPFFAHVRRVVPLETDAGKICRQFISISDNSGIGTRSQQFTQRVGYK